MILIANVVPRASRRSKFTNGLPIQRSWCISFHELHCAMPQMIITGMVRLAAILKYGILYTRIHLQFHFQFFKLNFDVVLFCWYDDALGIGCQIHLALFLHKEVNTANWFVYLLSGAAMESNCLLEYRIRVCEASWDAAVHRAWQFSVHPAPLSAAGTHC